MFTTKNYALLLASAVLAAVPSYATSITSSITGFSFTEDSSPFTSVLVESFSGSQASVTGTVTCASTTACSGEVGTFDLGLDLTSTTPLSAEISGILDGETPAGGSLNITSIFLSKDFPFSVTPGPFDKVLFATSLPALGEVNVGGSLDFSLAAGQTIDLPLTFNVGTPSNPSPVPEPASQALLVAGLLGMAGVVRYRNRNRTTA
jgi:PEP-CTERM motif